MKKPVMTIGRKSLLDFPAQGVYGVPAKVDTGADSSAIWASSIREQNGTLFFTLFDKTSPFYTGEEITTRNYQIVSVKNSFGISEFRYKVQLLTLIEGRKIKIRFTLADRSRTRSPILIGRRTLQGKFMVDVAKTTNGGEVRRMLIVSARRSKNVDKMIEAIQANMTDTQIDVTIYHHMVFSFIDGSMRVHVNDLGRDLADYDIVHFKTSIQRDITAAAARYADNNGVRVLDDIIKYFPTTSKLYQYALLSAEGIMIPNSLFMTPDAMGDAYDDYVKTLSVPFVLKGIHSSKGELNVVIRSQGDFDKAVQEAVRNDQYLVGQAFVENDGDYRILVLGKKIELVIHRQRYDESTHLNNTSQGGKATLIEPNELPSTVQIDSLKAVTLLGRDIAGVDMVQDRYNNKWYCFEVNDGPQLALGAFLEEKHKALARYFQKELEK